MLHSYGTQAQYGNGDMENSAYAEAGYLSHNLASDGAAMAPIDKKPFSKGKRKRLNMVAVWISLFVPWVLFVINFALLTFPVHYNLPGFVYAVVGLTLLGTLILGVFAYCDRKRLRMEAEYEPSWLFFLFLACLLAWIVSCVLGGINYALYIQPMEQMNHLNTYPNIDPSLMRGQQLMDAGAVTFSNTTSLDISRSMGFKNLDTYCVAPIVVKGASPSSYDFWAVGTNCCSGQQADFHCEESHNPRVRGGLRLLRATERPFYRLAVQQAEAAYQMRSDHPLFFHWVADPEASINQWKTTAYSRFLVGLFSYFLFQCFVTASLTLVFARLGNY